MTYIWQKVDKFITKMEQGVVLYMKKHQRAEIEYKKPSFHRHIASKRILTHTRK